MKVISFALSLVIAVASAQAAESIKPFTTDGCSAFPDGTLAQNQLWLACCTAHDIAYWQGGTHEERLTADTELETCVAGVGEPAVAALMLAGVRIGGSPYLPTEFRWGYGWDYPRGYRALTPEEKNNAQAELEKFGVGRSNSNNP
ncbi:MAG: hypothetical protein AseanaTS_27730 [Candidatus Pelagadaptatus aseana]|uniref:FAD-binding oxidoreductase n=1 Tax=Candidatus Pelagadaptatus aseana TaxID=3120508 RepID=UPI0039B2CFF7